MGLLRFDVPRPEHLPPELVARAYVAGLEGVPWLSQNTLANGELQIRRGVNESGMLFVPWEVAGHGQLVLSTTTLMESDAPYNLPLELARGTLHRARHQLAEWQSVGLRLSADLQSGMRQATSSFIRAATLGSPPSAVADAAEAALSDGLDLVRLLGTEYCRQALAVRHQQQTRLPTLFGVRLDPAPLSAATAKALASTFNAAILPVTWRHVEEIDGQPCWELFDRQLEWCRARGLKVCCGPLVDLAPQAIPDWLYLWEDDPDALRSYVLNHLQAVVERYRGRVHLWSCSARLNTEAALPLTEEARLRLAADSLQLLRRLDQRTPVIISLDQPWAEYLGRQRHDLSPLYFADALARGNLGLSGLGLEINLGYWPEGTQPRDLLEFSYQIDRWTGLGLPLVVLLTIPGGCGADPHAVHDDQQLAATAHGLPNPASQAALAEQLIPLLLSKQAVQAIFWNQLQDGVPHPFPHGGLFEATGQAKPALHSLRAIRRQYLA